MSKITKSSRTFLKKQISLILMPKKYTTNSIHHLNILFSPFLPRLSIMFNSFLVKKINGTSKRTKPI